MKQLQSQPRRLLTGGGHRESQAQQERRVERHPMQYAQPVEGDYVDAEFAGYDREGRPVYAPLAQTAPQWAEADPDARRRRRGVVVRTTDEEYLPPAPQSALSGVTPHQENLLMWALIVAVGAASLMFLTEPLLDLLRIIAMFVNGNGHQRY